MDVHISLAGERDLTGAIYRQLADAVAEGALTPGERLPATRALAAELGVARNTVAAAYDRLLAEGLTASRVGAGTFVSDIARRTGAPRRRQTTALQPSPLISGLLTDETERLADLERPPARYDFRIGLPDADLFPKTAWRREITHALRPTSSHPGDYGDPSGLPELRAAIARHVRLSRAVRADPDDVMVTAGAQHGIGLLARALLSPGDVVAVEDPGYPPIRVLLQTLGLRVAPVPVDGEGIRVDLLPERARAVYTTPSHQFPLGAPMSPARRKTLLDWADQHHAAVLEDDYDSEFRYAGRPLDALHALDRAGRVVYFGTFSKTLLPGLRLGFLVAPPSLRDGVRLVRRAAEWSPDAVPQAALAALIDSGAFAAGLRRARRVYAERHAALTSALAAELGGVLHAIPSHAGLHLAASLDARSERSARRIQADAMGEGVAVETLDSFHAGRPERGGLALGFGRIAAADIADGIRTLARVVR